jgi:outer membrane protein assembly factor BamB
MCAPLRALLASIRRRMTPSRKPRRWLLWVVAVAALGLIVLGVAYVVLTGRQGDISHPDVEFTPPTTTPQAQPHQQPKSAKDPGFEWPVYGYDRARTRYLPLDRPIHPKYRTAWRFHAKSLLEFSPVLSKRSLFVLEDNASLIALSRDRGRRLWARKLGVLAASSPAVGGGSVYAVVLKRSNRANAGRVVALNVGSGRTRWSRKLPSRAESSPLLDHGILYFGTENGTVYALRARDGSVKWSYRASGAVKGGLAMDYKGRLFFGDYAGKVYSLRSSNGRQLWKVGTSGARFGLGSGRFYATAAVAYGRVYIGNTDGNVYSYASSSGKLAWRIHTGGYVYGSAAVADVPGGSPTVYVGSYDRRFYALDARSGKKRWVRKAGGRVSGGAVVIGDTVWFSTLERQTRALGARTGNRLWTAQRGQFNPVVSDGERIYLVGSYSLTALEPRSAQPPVAKKQHRKHAKKKHPKAKRHAKKHPKHAKKHHKRVKKQHHKRAAKHAKRHRPRHHYKRGDRVCFRSHGHRRCHPKGSHK